MNKYNHWLGKLFGFFNGRKNYAVTFGQTAYFSCSQSQVSAVWQKHEDIHKEQYKRDGWIKFLAVYIWQGLTKGYKNISYEIEAREKSKG